jgi:chromosome segregation ATPase
LINIFSINEIVNATNNLLLEAHEDEKKIINNYSSMVNKNNETTNLDVEKNIFPEGQIPGEIENIILEAENSQIQTKIKEPTKEIGNDNENYVEEFKVNKDELIESMHKTFSKKIKKNTLKLILDLREEIIFLNKNISSLKERKKKEELNNKILKKNVFDLKQIENKLDHHLKRIQAELDSLKNKNEKLNLDYDLLNEQHKDLIEKNTLLNNDNIQIKSELAAYINKDSISQSKIIKLEEEILNNNNHLNETTSDNEKVKSELNEYKKTEKDLIEKNILLNNDNIQIKSKLVAYINEDSISQSKIIKLEEEISNNNNYLNETTSDNEKVKSELAAYINEDSISQSKIIKLEEEISNNNNLFNKTASNDEEIKSELNEYKNTEKNLREKNQELQKSINDLKSNVNHNDRDKTIRELEDKIKHYQDENIRIGSELFESNKKFEITKESLSELQNNRSHLIEKINSINEVIKNENVVTSVFSSDLEDSKIKIIDNNKTTKKDTIDINEKIKNIFLKD